jgi:hypothetical protein
VPGIGESTGEKVQGAAEKVVSVKVQTYREELEKQRAEEAARIAEEAARIAEEEAAAADESGGEPVMDDEIELSEESEAVEATASDDDKVGGPTESEGR